MNKTLLIIAALATTTVGCWGRPISPDAALARISGDYDAKHNVKSPAMSSPRLIVTGKEANQATYYVFATQSQTLIVSADDLAYPLLGYIDNPSVDFDNLANVGPVLYGGSGTLGGHEFVCDGYSSDGYFHIN